MVVFVFFVYLFFLNCKGLKEKLQGFSPLLKFWLVLAGFGWFWLVLANPYGKIVKVLREKLQDNFPLIRFWLVLAGFGWFWLVLANHYGKIVKV